VTTGAGQGRGREERGVRALREKGNDKGGEKKRKNPLISNISEIAQKTEKEKKRKATISGAKITRKAIEETKLCCLAVD